MCIRDRPKTVKVNKVPMAMSLEHNEFCCIYALFTLGVGGCFKRTPEECKLNYRNFMFPKEQNVKSETARRTTNILQAQLPPDTPEATVKGINGKSI